MTTDLAQLLSDWKIEYLYHFTDRRNIPSIREHGLLSWAELRRRGIKPLAPGGNDWSHDADAVRGMDEFVHLCLMSEHPMEYRAREDGRIIESVFIPVSADILFVRERSAPLMLPTSRESIPPLSANRFISLILKSPISAPIGEIHWFGSAYKLQENLRF